MIVERAMHPQFLSNTYLVADGNGGPAFFIDAGGPVAPLIETAERLELKPTHVLLTHHHFDHISDVGDERYLEGLAGLVAGEQASGDAAGASRGEPSGETALLPNAG